MGMWTTNTLGEVAIFSQGIQIGLKEQKNVFENGYVRFIRIVDYTQNTDETRYVKDPGEKYKIKADDIVMVRYGTPGLIGRGKEGVIANNLFQIKITEPGLTNDYLVHFLSQSSIQKFLSTQGSATMPALNFSQLKTIHVKFPSISEQKRIVSILDTVFAGLEQTRVKTEQNLKNARELFDSYLQQVFSQKGEDYNTRSMSDKSMLLMIDGDRGKNYPKKSEFLSEGHCLFLSTKNVRPNGFLFEQTMFIDEHRDSLLRKGKLERNDVVLTTRGTIGNLALYDEKIGYDNIRINSGMLILRPNTEIILPSYLFEIMRSEIVRKQIDEKVSGAAQPQLPVNTLNSFSFPVPLSLEEQKIIVDSIRKAELEINRLTNIYQKKLIAIDELKKSILQKAFSGELTNTIE